MTQEPQLEDRLRAALRRPEGSTWPEGHGAFDQFLHRRARRSRALAARGALAVVVAVALVVGPPPGRAGEPAAHGPAAAAARRRLRGHRAGRLDRPEQVPEGRYPRSGLGSAVGLRPMRRAANTMVMLHTGSLSSAQYPGTEPGGGGQDSSFGADQTTGRLEDRGGTLGRGRRPDGRPYVWQQTLLGTNQVARYAIAWPYHCTPQRVCPPGARWRVLLVDGVSEEGPATLSHPVCHVFR